MLGTAQFQAIQQAAEPFLRIQEIGPLPIGIVLGLAGSALTLILMENRTFPAGLTISMGLANLASSAIGSMPLCHDAGGLAAHYRFGARTAGSNLMIGGFFVLMGFLFGRHALAFLHLLPMAVLGILLVFAGAQLAMTIMDLQTRKEIFVSLLILGITLASNLAAGFMVGTAVAYALKSEKLQV